MSDAILDQSTFGIDEPGPGEIARRDILAGIRNWYLWGLLGWLDIRQRYRRSLLGPFWLTISMGVTVAALGVLYSFLFKISTAELLPWLTVGFILWALINGIISESCTCFIGAEGVIKQVQIPMTLHLLRVLWRNLIIMAHNLAILPIIYVIYGLALTPTTLLVIPGMALLILNLSWFCLLVGMVCTRFRDLPQIVASVMQIAFYVTPIIWKPALLPPEWQPLLDLNPFYHLMDVVRSPLLGVSPQPQSWAYDAGFLVFGACLTVAVYSRFHRRIPYWL